MLGFRFLKTIQPTSTSILKAALRNGNGRPLIRLLSDGAAGKDAIKKIVDSDKVVVFMKGTAEEPMCGFSKLVCQILQIHEVPFSSFNVLEDEEVRQGVKEYAEWPTIPQVYMDGEFIGGSDILLGLHQSGEILDTLHKHGLASKYSTPEGSPKDNK